MAWQAWDDSKVLGLDCTHTLSMTDMRMYRCGRCMCRLLLDVELYVMYLSLNYVCSSRSLYFLFHYVAGSALVKHFLMGFRSQRALTLLHLRD